MLLDYGPIIVLGLVIIHTIIVALVAKTENDIIEDWDNGTD